MDKGTIGTHEYHEHMKRYDEHTPFLALHYMDMEITYRKGIGILG